MGIQQELVTVVQEVEIEGTEEAEIEEVEIEEAGVMTVEIEEAVVDVEEEMVIMMLVVLTVDQIETLHQAVVAKEAIYVIIVINQVTLPGIVLINP